MFWSVWSTGRDSLKLFFSEGHWVVCPAVWCGHMTVGPARLNQADYWKSTVHVVDSDRSSRSALHLSPWAILQSCFKSMSCMTNVFIEAVSDLDDRHVTPRVSIWESAAVCWSVSVLICEDSLSVSVRMIIIPSSSWDSLGVSSAALTLHHLEACLQWWSSLVKFTHLKCARFL